MIKNWNRPGGNQTSCLPRCRGRISYDSQGQHKALSASYRFSLDVLPIRFGSISVPLKGGDSYRSTCDSEKSQLNAAMRELSTIIWKEGRFPMRLNYHRHLHRRKAVGSVERAHNSHWLLRIPVGEQVGPQSVLSSGLAPCMSLIGILPSFQMTAGLDTSKSIGTH